MPGMVPYARDTMEQYQALNNTHLHHNTDLATQNDTPEIACDLLLPQIHHHGVPSTWQAQCDLLTYESSSFVNHHQSALLCVGDGPLKPSLPFCA